MGESQVLTYDDLRAAVVGSAAAFRLRLKLQPAGGCGDKVFPPTYEKGQYATEERRIAQQTVPCVLLDSVQSQANRMEWALQTAWEDQRIELPVISADFQGAGHPGIRKITSLQAPHRIADAILRDSLLGKTKFRNSPVGLKLNQITMQYATPLYEHCPTALVFGMWDSTGPRGGLGVKFARAMVSEIIGVNAVMGVKTSSRIDPLNIRVSSGVVYEGADGWTLDANAARKDAKKNPVKVGEGKPSNVNHGNVTPTKVDGGYTLDYAEQVTVLSLPALRRLRFPLKPDQRSEPAVDQAARVYLAALGLLGATLAADDGYDLRSRCQLNPVDPLRWALLGRPGEAERTFDLPTEEAIKLTKAALAACDKVGLPFQREEITLIPEPGLLELVRKSVELAAKEGGQG